MSLRRDPRPRRLVAAVALTAAAPLLLGCGPNFDPQTNAIYTPAQGVNDRDGDVDVLNALVVSDGTSGRLVAGLANGNLETEDQLVGVTTQQEGVTVSVGAGDQAIPATGFLQLADPTAAMVSVTGPEVRAGYYVELTLAFANAEPVTLNMPVVDSAPPFADVELPGPSEPGSTEGSNGAGEPGADEPAAEPTETPEPSPTEAEE